MVALPPPAHIHQLDGSAWGPSGCMGAAGAMALDAYTRGAIRPGMAAIRANQDDKAGGIGLDDVATAWKRGYGLTFTHGTRSWSAILSRLRDGGGVVITCNYGAMRTYRAPGSKFAGAHALYLQRTVTTPAGSLGTAQTSIIVNDPLRRSSVTIPENVLRLAYTGGAGWGSGVYGVSLPGQPTADSLGAFYAGGVPLVVYRRESTGWRADDIIRTLHAADFFGARLNPAAWAAEDIARGVFRADEGRPWNDALLREWQSELRGAAVTAGADPLAALGQLVPAVQELPARAGIVAGIVVLGLLGVYLTFRESSTVVLPAGRALAAAKGIVNA